MDTYENENLDQETVNPQPQPEPVTQPEPYRNVGAGRKESPYADSPYVTYQQPGWQSNAGVPPTQNPYQQTAYQNDPAPKPKKKKSGKGWKRALAAVLAVVLVAGSCGITAFCVNNHWENRFDELNNSMNRQIESLKDQIQSVGNTGNSVSGSPVSSDGGLTPGQVYAQNAPSVVLITCEVTSSMYGQAATGISSGSGFILTEDGYIVTNCHVVEGARSVTVTTYAGDEYSAEIIGTDSTNDVAVLKVEADKTLPAVTIGSSDDLIIGDMVVAIGNPLGELTSTQTVGYVSGKDRDVTTEDKTINMIQTDCAINSGNSGGPLFNMKGEVVGITTAKYSGSSSSGASIEGIGFAIPIDDVIGMLEDLAEFGYITGAYLGVSVLDMDVETASIYGLPVGTQVQEVVAGACAEKAGVQVGDIIIGLGSHEVENYSDLSRALRKFEAGDTTTITVFRSGREITLEITLDEKPQPADQSQPTTPDVPDDSQMPSMPSNGDFEDWYDYFYYFFGR